MTGRMCVCARVHTCPCVKGACIACTADLVWLCGGAVTVPVPANAEDIELAEDEEDVETEEPEIQLQQQAVPVRK